MFHFGIIVHFILIQFATSHPGASPKSLHGNTVHYSLVFDPEGQLLNIVPDHGAFDGVHLNLSGETRLRTWSPGIFNFAKDAKVVDFSSTSIDKLPEDAFKDFTKLEILNLSNNKLESLEGAPFANLRTLKRLDLTNNRIQDVGPGYFSGLGNDTDILISGNNITSIKTWIFKDLVTQLSSLDSDVLTPEPIIIEELPYKVKACIREGTLEKLEVMTDDETLEGHCREVRISSEWQNQIFLNRTGIVNFATGWYRLQKDHRLPRLNLAENNIIELSNVILSKLPESTINVNLAGNKIERLAKGSVANRYLKFLTLSNNSISEIEDGAFTNGNLMELYLDGNRLTDTKFVTNLPPTLKIINLSRNQINELSPNAFSKLQNVKELDLSFNSIGKIRDNSLRGLSNVNYIYLRGNKIRTIDSGSFHDLKKLKNLYLQKNHLQDLEAGTFENFEYIQEIDLSFNNLTKVGKDYFPHTIDIFDLNLSFNQIEVLETGAFSNNRNLLPFLNLGNNKINKIERGAFNVSGHILDLRNNLWSHPDGEVFKDLLPLEHLNLQNNGITNIEKGFAKYLRNVNSITLSQNPIRELKNGALYGLSMSSWQHTDIEIADTPLELIQSGLFADV